MIMSYEKLQSHTVLYYVYTPHILDDETLRSMRLCSLAQCPAYSTAAHLIG